jgi:hypothetical protein
MVGVTITIIMVIMITDLHSIHTIIPVIITIIRTEIHLQLPGQDGTVVMMKDLPFEIIILQEETIHLSTEAEVISTITDRL